MWLAVTLVLHWGGNMFLVNLCRKHWPRYSETSDNRTPKNTHTVAMAKCRMIVLQKTPIGVFCNTIILHLSATCLYYLFFIEIIMWFIEVLLYMYDIARLDPDLICGYIRSTLIWRYYSISNWGQDQSTKLY